MPIKMAKVKKNDAISTCSGEMKNGVYECEEWVVGREEIDRMQGDMGSRGKSLQEQMYHLHLQFHSNT